MMPTQPGTHFIVIRAQTIFAFLNGYLHWPAQAGHTNQFRDRRFRRRIAEIDLELRIVAQRTTEDDPYIRTRQPVPNSPRKKANSTTIGTLLPSLLW